jgi:hypothetical protein
MAETEAAIPTVVVRASAGEDAQRELFDVEVRVDGVVLATRLDGRALPVNPGERHFTFSASGRIAREERLVVRVGEKHRLLAVVLPPEKPELAAVVTQPTPAPSRITTPARVLLIAGGAALATAAGFGVSGWLEVRSLRQTCAPTCPQSDVDAARLRLRIADISLAAGVAALAGAGLLIWSRPHSPHLSLTPLPQGALLSLAVPPPSP